MKSPITLCAAINKTVRTIRVDKDDSKECVAVYTKAGVDKEVGRGQNFNSCVKIVDNIREPT
jgi:hypothetical protein